MSQDPHDTALIVRRRVGAAPERVFAAWTEPRHLARWWGPAPVTCAGADVDLRVGGAYRIGNRFPDGSELWITGVFERVERPTRLVYSWAHEPVGADTRWSRVTVRFEPDGDGTEVVVVHERLADADDRARHQYGWQGCLDKLADAFTTG